MTWARGRPNQYFLSAGTTLYYVWRVELTSGGASQIEPIDFMKEYWLSLEQFQTFAKLLAFTMKAFLGTKIKKYHDYSLRERKIEIYCIWLSETLTNSPGYYHNFTLSRKKQTQFIAFVSLFVSQLLGRRKKNWGQAKTGRDNVFALDFVITSVTIQ